MARAGQQRERDDGCSLFSSATGSNMSQHYRTTSFTLERTRSSYEGGSLTDTGLSFDSPRVLHYLTFSWHGHGTSRGIPWHPHGIPWRGIGLHGAVGGVVDMAAWGVSWHAMGGTMATLAGFPRYVAKKDNN